MQAQPIALERYERYAAPPDAGGCRIWTGPRTGPGYGCLIIPTGKRGGLHIAAHRWAYEHFVGPIPEGLHICHHCDNPPCVNPEHLFAGTRSDNMRDKMAKGRGNYEIRRNIRGEENARAVLTEAAVRDIRARYVPRKVPLHVLAAEYGVGETTIGAVVRGETWRHVKPS